MTYSPTNVCSTIGAVGLNFSVRNGKRWIPDAINRLNMCTVHLYNTLQEKEYESQTSENSFVEQFYSRSLITRYPSKALDVCSRVGAAQVIHSCTERKALGQLVLLD